MLEFVFYVTASQIDRFDRQIDRQIDVKGIYWSEYDCLFSIISYILVNITLLP